MRTEQYENRLKQDVRETREVLDDINDFHNKETQ